MDKWGIKPISIMNIQEKVNKSDGFSKQYIITSPRFVHIPKPTKRFLSIQKTVLQSYVHTAFFKNSKKTYFI